MALTFENAAKLYAILSASTFPRRPLATAEFAHAHTTHADVVKRDSDVGCR
jgi:hypothetical protein